MCLTANAVRRINPLRASLPITVRPSTADCHLSSSLNSIGSRWSRQAGMRIPGSLDQVQNRVVYRRIPEAYPSMADKPRFAHVKQGEMRVSSAAADVFTTSGYG
jgi:hypothetical protein